MQDLKHANEYVQGSTLRFLTHLKEAEILEPLVPSVRVALNHRHSYVKRNAILAVFCIFKIHPDLIPDGVELVSEFLRKETDPACRRNAFIMLTECSSAVAASHLSEFLDEVLNMGEVFQFAILQLIRHVCREQPDERARYVRAVYTLLTSSSPAVQYDAAAVLLSLSGAPVAVKAASSAYIKLMVSESDNNIKMVVLDRLGEVRKRSPKVLQDLVMDLLRGLDSSNMDVRRKVLDIALDLTTPKNVEEVILLLKKEVGKTQSVSAAEGMDEYRQMLIGAIHTSAVKFPEVASSVVHLMTDFLSDPNPDTAEDVIRFVRDVMEAYPALRSGLLRKLLDNLSEIKSSRVIRAALWIIGESALDYKDVDHAFKCVKQALGDTPFIPQEDNGADGAEAADESAGAAAAQQAAVPASRPKILADGSYATETDVVQASSASSAAASSSSSGRAGDEPVLRAHLLKGNFFVGAALGGALTKLALRVSRFEDLEEIVKNAVRAEVLLILTCILRLGDSSVVSRPIEKDSRERLVQCANVLLAANPGLDQIFLDQTHTSFSDMLKGQTSERKKLADAAREKNGGERAVQPDDVLVVRQLAGGRAAGELEMEAQEDLSKVTGTAADEEKPNLARQLERMMQLTGFSDPIYAEAFMDVHQYDIALHVTLVNQTGDTLQNVTMELATLGDLKLIERPQNITLGPYAEKKLSANIKVSSSDTAVIFGNLVYDIAGSSTYSSDRNCVILNEIRIDIMDYILPATCSETQFRSWWREFEWENRVAVATQIREPRLFLDHILKVTNMNCLTPKAQLEGESGFIAANLYAKSVFGEDALANLSVERAPDGNIMGTVRIRAKTHGIAVSLGDKINASMNRKD
jgi:coatomer subunit beta